MVAIRGSLVDKGPMVRRVRKFLECVDEGASYPVNSDRTGRQLCAQDHGEAESDLQDIEARLRKVRELFPDLQVEESPHLVQVRQKFGKVANPSRESGAKAWTSRRGGATE